ncbi:MAG TPA: nitronate monooxygenase [Solirubrobacteraceae bacterium]|jgi:nitronate monooxygenase|nr:nitronate monooxygenase [Solirubrobacteraceae bacterium]
MITTRFTDMVGCRAPIQQAPIGQYARTAVLPRAVARAGGHGIVAAIDTPRAELEAALDELDGDAGGAWGVNVVVPLTPPECVQLAAERAPFVDFHQGDPSPALVEAVHRNGGIASWQVGTAEEARAAEQAGCDMIVAQGIEGGAFVRGRAGTMALLQEVLDSVSIPVLAAGGIGTARGVAAALAAGAAGVRVGTRFLAATEAGAEAGYVEALTAARAEDTVLTDRFSPPDIPIRARALRAGVDIGEPLLAGESTGAVHGVQPAAEIVHELVDGAEALLEQAARLVAPATDARRAAAKLAR